MIIIPRQTEEGIYYLHDYIPTRAFRYHSDEEVELSREIWAYKDGDENAMNRFTNELMHAISFVSRGIVASKIGLVAVPPSKVDKYSPIRASIWNIHNWYQQGITSTYFGCDKTIYDYGNLLTRETDINTSHQGRGARATYDEQKASIACSRQGLSKYWTTFFILDDVTTIGTSMDVCRDILIENGAVEKYIYRMAIAKTI